MKFTVNAKLKGSDKPQTFEVNGGEIRSQEDADKHFTAHHPQFEIVKDAAKK